MSDASYSSERSITNDNNTQRIEHGLENALGDDARARISGILDEVSLLSNVEKLLLYLKLPSGSHPTNPSESSECKPEVAQAVRWLKTHLEPDQDYCLFKQGVYDEYRGFCEGHGYKPLTVHEFGKCVRTLCPDVKTRRLGQRGNTKHCYGGLKKLTEVPPPTLPHVKPPDPVFQKNEGTKPGVSAPALEAADVVLEWAQKLLNSNFPNVQTLAEHLIRNGYVSGNSIQAFSVLSASQNSRTVSTERDEKNAASTTRSGPANTSQRITLRLQQKLKEKVKFLEQKRLLEEQVRSETDTQTSKESTRTIDVNSTGQKSADHSDADKEKSKVQKNANNRELISKSKPITPQKPILPKTFSLARNNCGLTSQGVGPSMGIPPTSKASGQPVFLISPSQNIAPRPLLVLSPVTQKFPTKATSANGTTLLPNSCNLLRPRPVLQAPVLRSSVPLQQTLTFKAAGPSKQVPAGPVFPTVLQTTEIDQAKRAFSNHCISTSKESSGIMCPNTKANPTSIPLNNKSHYIVKKEPTATDIVASVYTSTVGSSTERWCPPADVSLGSPRLMAENISGIATGITHTAPPDHQTGKLFTTFQQIQNVNGRKDQTGNLPMPSVSVAGKLKSALTCSMSDLSVVSDPKKIIVPVTPTAEKANLNVGTPPSSKSNVRGKSRGTPSKSKGGGKKVVELLKEQRGYMPQQKLYVNDKRPVCELLKESRQRQHVQLLHGASSSSKKNLEPLMLHTITINNTANQVIQLQQQTPQTVVSSCEKNAAVQMKQGSAQTQYTNVQTTVSPCGSDRMLGTRSSVHLNQQHQRLVEGISPLPSELGGADHDTSRIVEASSHLNNLEIINGVKRENFQAQINFENRMRTAEVSLLNTGLNKRELTASGGKDFSLGNVLDYLGREPAPELADITPSISQMIGTQTVANLSKVKSDTGLLMHDPTLSEPQTLSQNPVTKAANIPSDRIPPPLSHVGQQKEQRLLKNVLLSGRTSISDSPIENVFNEEFAMSNRPATVSLDNNSDPALTLSQGVLTMAMNKVQSSDSYSPQTYQIVTTPTPFLGGNNTAVGSPAASLVSPSSVVSQGSIRSTPASMMSPQANPTAVGGETAFIPIQGTSMETCSMVSPIRPTVTIATTSLGPNSNTTSFTTSTSQHMPLPRPGFQGGGSFMPYRSQNIPMFYQTNPILIRQPVSQAMQQRWQFAQTSVAAKRSCSEANPTIAKRFRRNSGQNTVREVSSASRTQPEECNKDIFEFSCGAGDISSSMQNPPESPFSPEMQDIMEDDISTISTGNQTFFRSRSVPVHSRVHSDKNTLLLPQMNGSLSVRKDYIYDALQREGEDLSHLLQDKLQDHMTPGRGIHSTANDFAARRNITEMLEYKKGDDPQDNSRNFLITGRRGDHMISGASVRPNLRQALSDVVRMKAVAMQRASSYPRDSVQTPPSSQNPTPDFVEDISSEIEDNQAFCNSKDTGGMIPSTMDTPNSLDAMVTPDGADTSDVNLFPTVYDNCVSDQANAVGRQQMAFSWD